MHTHTHTHTYTHTHTHTHTYTHTHTHTHTHTCMCIAFPRSPNVEEARTPAHTTGDALAMPKDKLRASIGAAPAREGMCVCERERERERERDLPLRQTRPV